MSGETIEAEIARLTAERDNWQKRAEAAERASAVDAQTVQRMTAEVHRLKDAGEQLIAECNRVSAERDAALTDKHCLRLELEQVRVRCNEAREERDAAELERTESRAEVVRLTAERDSARAEVVPAVLSLREERDAAQNETHELRRQYAKLHAEAEGLRADLLAHPPEPHQELAAERQRHVELMEDYDRKNVMIGILEDAVKRTENALKTAQVKRIDPRLKGLLSVLSRTASEAEEMLP